MAKDKAKDKQKESKQNKESKKSGETKEKKEVKAKKAKSKKTQDVEDVKEDPQPATAQLEQPTPGEEAKEVAEEKVEELKEEEEPEEAVGEAKKPEEEEEAAPEEEQELEIVEEKFYSLNLRKIWSSPREKRTPRAVRFLRDYVARHMKSDEVAISEEANSMLWQRGISKPPRKIRVRAVKDKDGRVIVFPGEGKGEGK